ncbi:MAG: hypothetical protein M3Y79_15735 [Pseudomonadota bacterium]|nr:hypothetical protein [Pseudomonadota bacterium]
MKRRGIASLAAVVAAGIALAALPASAAAPSPPDLNGIWSPVGTGTGGARGEGAGQSLPLRPEAKQRHDAFNAIVSPTGDTPGGVCLGAGMPGMLMGGGGYPMEIIQQPRQITMIFELHGEARRVYFGDRNAPVKDRVPGRSGYSSGRWEGNELVIETTSLVEQLDQRTTPHSEHAVIVERYRVEGPDGQGRRVLVADVTMTDPEFYAQPVKFTRRWTEVPGGHLLPYECNEEFWFNRVEELAKKAGRKLP